jgi:hypothetical protein
MRTRAPCTSTPARRESGRARWKNPKVQSAPRLAVGACEEELARPDLAFERGADQVERAGLGRDDGIVAEPPEHERPEAVAVAEGEESAVGEADDRGGALELLHRRADRLDERPLVVRDQRSHHLAVGGRREAARELGPQLARVDQVAVVPERDRARAAVVEQRLRVRPGVRAGRRVASVSDRDLAVQAREVLLVEHLRHEAEVAQRREPCLVGDGNPGRLLTAVLERVQAEVREPRDVAVGGVDAEDAAHQRAGLPGREASRAVRAWAPARTRACG